MRILAAQAAALALTASPAAGAFWLPGTGITATASSEFNTQRQPLYAINGAGMAGDCHASALADGTNWMTKSGSAIGAWIKLDLGAVRDLHALRVWNFNWKNATADYTVRGVKQCDLYVSASESDPGSTFPGAWTAARMNHALARAPGEPTYTGEPAIDLQGHRARWIALRIDANHEITPTYAGLSELRVYLAEPLPELRVADTSVSEGQSGSRFASFHLRLTMPPTNDVMVAYATSNLTAEAGADYLAATGTVTFLAGQTEAIVDVSVLGDEESEPDEQFALVLRPGAGVSPWAPLPVCTILNDEDLAPAIAILAPSDLEPTGARLRAALTAAAPDADVRFFWGRTDAGAHAAGWDASASAGIQAPGTVAFPVNGLASNEWHACRAMASNRCGIAWSDVVRFRTARVSLLLEAESFSHAGGWSLDGQFIETMGSPYLLAHGLGTPVADAQTVVSVTGVTCRVWARTRDWCPDHPDAPGRFRIAFDGVETGALLGTNTDDWAWQDAGLVSVTGTAVTVALRDLTGYDGRCDAVYLTSDLAERPPDAAGELAVWRRRHLALPDQPADGGSYDAVVVGGGIGGCAAAIAAARSGIRVALVQDRPVLGGNASQEVRVHTMGARQAGSIVDEIDTPGYPNGDPQAAVYDAVRQSVVTAEPNITLFLGWRAYAAATNGNRITSVDIRHQRLNTEKRLTAPLFIDCTGDGWLGFWAGADWRMGREARDEHGESLAPVTADAMTMGNTLQWRTRDTGVPVQMAPVPWATAVAGSYAATSGDWDWEYGLHLNTIYDAERIRDHMLRAIYGSFSNAKQNPVHANRALEWVAYVAGKRESRRLLGDHILTEQDVKQGVFFADAVAQGTWSIDLHYTKSYPTFMTYASQTSVAPYWFPFRCLYSRNIRNLMMAGRNLSATHVGLGSPRVMNTCGQMGVAVGYAAAICTRYGIEPRAVYQDHIQELQAMIGGTPEPPPPPEEPPQIILDNSDPAGVTLVGAWTTSTTEPGYHGSNYLHDGNSAKGQKSVTYRPTLPASGQYHVFARWTSGPTRGTNVVYEVHHADGTAVRSVNQRAGGAAWTCLGTWRFTAGATGAVVLRNSLTDGGHVIADAVAFSEQDRDRDGDGLPDWWELRHFGDPTAATADGDPDHDGSRNIGEYRAGCDPNDPGSRFEVAQSLLAADQRFRLEWPSTSNRTYAVESTADLRQPFGTLVSNIPATPPRNQVEVMIGGASQSFYRVRAED